MYIYLCPSCNIYINASLFPSTTASPLSPHLKVRSRVSSVVYRIYCTPAQQRFITVFLDTMRMSSAVREAVLVCGTRFLDLIAVRATLHPVPPDLKRYHTLIILHSIQQEGARVGCPNTNECSLVATRSGNELEGGPAVSAPSDKEASRREKGMRRVRREQNLLRVLSVG